MTTMKLKMNPVNLSTIWDQCRTSDTRASLHANPARTELRQMSNSSNSSSVTMVNSSRSTSRIQWWRVKLLNSKMEQGMWGSRVKVMGERWRRHRGGSNRLVRRVVTAGIRPVKQHEICKNLYKNRFNRPPFYPLHRTSLTQQRRTSIAWWRRSTRSRNLS